MAKLSTGKLKEMISVWFGENDNLKGYIKRFFLDLDEEELAEVLPNWAKDLKCKADYDSVSQAIWNQFSNGEYWSRDTKNKCEEDHYDDSKFDPDVDGWRSDKFSAKDIGKCTLRIFVPKNLGDNFRLEVITDALDSEVLMWELIVD